jgi:outer membrane protein TolC
MVSQNDYETAKNSYAKLVNDRDAKEVAIDNAFVSLNKAMNRDLTKRYQLSLELRYVPMANVSLTSVITYSLQQSPDVKKRRSDADVAAYQLETYYSTDGGTSRETMEIRALQADRAVGETISQIEQTLTTLYNELRNLETSYTTNKLELENMYQQLALREKQLEVGKLTQLDVDSYKYQIARMEETIRNQAYNHALKLAQFQNPNLALM